MVSNGSKNKEIMDKVASVILAGGQGTRLYPLTQTRCKPAVCFGGRYRLIDIPISNSLNANIHRIIIISQYFASSLHQHILETYQLDYFRLSRSYCYALKKLLIEKCGLKELQTL